MVLVIIDIVPLRQRPKHNGYANWRCIFYVNFPFCAVGLLITPLLLTFEKLIPPWCDALLAVDLARQLPLHR
jgi:hypothetical protein